MQRVREQLSSCLVHKVEFETAIGAAKLHRNNEQDLVGEYLSKKKVKLSEKQHNLLIDTINALMDIDNLEWELVVSGNWRLGAATKRQIPEQSEKFDLLEGYLGDPLDWDFQVIDPTGTCSSAGQRPKS